MSTNKTQHYHLHAWEAGDNFLRTEINENFTALDGALKAEADARIAAVKAETDARVAAVNGEASARTSLKTSLEGKISTRSTSLSERGRWVTGTYAGNGTNGREIKLSGPILALLPENNRGFRTQVNFGGLILPGAPMEGNKGWVSGNSFFVSADYLNIFDYSYYYLALVYDSPRLFSEFPKIR